MQSAAVAEHRQRRRGVAMREAVLKRRRRWRPEAKAELCMALRGGVVSLDEVTAHHGLAREEIASWLGAFARFGAEGLKVTKRCGGRR